uniref:Endoplasmic reticulum lectin 1 n=1 Tax=Globodera pallida TaxID=36090 RepID=A0A183BV31_GLOPA
MIMTLPLRTSSVVELKELDYLRALDDSISYRIVFRPFDELPEKYLNSLLTTTSPTTTSAQTTTAAQSAFSEPDSLDDDTNKKLEESEQSDQRQQREASSSSSSDTTEQHKLVRIVSDDAEEYQCMLPVLAPSSKKRIESYHGPSPAELVQSIYRDQICSYRIESYWNYELCHGRYVLQYHEDKESKQRTEYFLGNFVAKNAEVEAKNFDQLSPPTRKLGDDRLAYYPVTYTHGTVCDLTGKPRQVTVLYVCDEEGRQNIHSINEISSCHYELIVLSSEICAHPSFQRPPAKEYEIRCYATAAVAALDESDESAHDPKPKALQKLEEEQRKEFFGEYGLYRSSSPAQSTKNVFAKILKLDEDALEAGFNQLNAILEAIKKSNAPNQQRDGAGTDDGSTPEGGDGAASAHSPPKHGSANEPSLVERFWRGDVCLQGGTGWWKHEVCFGRTVSQYHEEVDGTDSTKRQSILLGKFDEAVHKAWATEHPGKAVERKVDGTVMQVSHMYTQGDVCVETGAHRDCQVRIKCREDISAQKVFIYMLEPSTCSYVVVLESAMFCARLQHVDEFGLLSPEAAALIDDEAAAQQPNKQLKDKLTKRAFGDTTMVFDLANQEEIMRVVRNLIEGAGDGQVLVSAAKLKFGKSAAAVAVEEEEEVNREAEQQAGEGGVEEEHTDNEAEQRRVEGEESNEVRDGGESTEEGQREAKKNVEARGGEL